MDMFQYGSLEQGPMTRRRKAAILCCLGVPYVLAVIALIVALSLPRNDVTDKDTLTLQARFTASVEGLAHGTVVSLSPDGAAQPGGGTSVYYGLPLPSQLDTCLKHLDVDAKPDGSGIYLASFDDTSSEATGGTLATLSVSADPLGGVALLDAVDTDLDIYELSFLDSSSFVGVTQSLEADGTAEVYSGTVGSTGAVSLSAQPPAVLTTGYSLAPAVARLSDASFAVVYYAGATVATRAGYLVGGGPVVSDEVAAVDNTNFTVQAGVVALSASLYAVLYYDGAGSGAGPLVAVPALVAPSGDDGSAPPEVELDGASSATLSAAVTLYFDADRLDDNCAVVAYVDADQNNALVASLLTYDDSFGLQWASTVVLSSGGALVQSETFGFMDIDVTAVAPVTSDAASSFLVYYSDATNSGSLTTTGGKLTTSGELVKSLPDFVVGAPVDLGSTFVWAALSATSDNEALLLSSAEDGDCSSITASAVVVELMPAPFGVVTSGGSAARPSIVFGGRAKEGLSGLTPGKVYFGDTQGRLLESPSYGGYLSSVDGTTYYVTDADSKTMVALDGMVGVASTEKALYVSTNT